MDPVQFFKCLADDTRLKCLLLIAQEEELCVCELTEALELSQPKVSRHLAQLRKCNLLQDRREGQWIFYSINPQLEDWALNTLQGCLHNNLPFIDPCCQRLHHMGDRPVRKNACC